MNSFKRAVVEVGLLAAVLSLPASATAGGDAGVPADATSSSASPSATADAGDTRRAETSRASPDAGPNETPVEQLEREFGLRSDILDSVSALSERLQSESEQISRLEDELEERNDDLVVQRSKLEALADQVGSLSETGAATFAVGIARHQIAVARTQGAMDRIRAALERKRRAVSLLETRIENLQSGGPEHEERLRSEQRARRAEREAKEALETARKRQQRERDRKLEALNTRQQEIAEKRLDSTRTFQEEIRQVRGKTDEIREAFAQQEVDLLDQMRRLPDAPSDREAREQVDPLFESIVDLHRKKLSDHGEAVREQRSASERIGKARRALDEAKSQLRRARRQQRDYKGSKLWKRRVEVAQARVEWRQQELEEAREWFWERRRRARALREQLASLEGWIEDLLPRVSEATYDSYYRLVERHNWVVALDNLEFHVRRVYDDLRDRSDQLAEIADHPFALSTWTVIGGLAWRLLVLVLLLRFVFPAIPAVTKEVTNWLLNRPFFRHRPAATVKLVDSLAAVVRPLTVYLVVVMVGAYLARTLPELEVVLWAVDAAFLYWVIIGVLSALVRPGSRRDRGRSSYRSRASEHLASEHLATSAVDEARAAADLTGMNRSHAEKFLRSGRIVAAFWILAAYVPDFVAEFTGPTVVLYLVRQVATWGFVFVVYWVLSAWRDDISELFGRLVDPRLDRAAEFVRDHKDRPWGVLVIGAASLYVLFVEAVRLVRKYLLNAEWFQRASAFAFQKSVELQQSEASEGAGPRKHSRIPDEYSAQFADAPLQAGDDCLVERERERSAILDQHAAWRERGRQGSAALVGESGVGRTTLLNQLEAELSDRADRENDASSRVVTQRAGAKFSDASEVVRWLAEAFELPEDLDELEALVEALRDLEPRTVLLDDCENVFLRRTGGFDGLEALIDIVTRTDDRHFWVLAFHDFSWSYLNRIRERSHYFGDVVEIQPWTESELREFIEKRNAASGMSVSFEALDSGDAPDDASSRFVDVVQASAGYFRYLSTFSEGNPRVAATYWLRSLEYEPHRDRLHVHLFRRPPTEPLVDLEDDHWFVLTALAQHSELDAEQLAAVTNIDRDFCLRALDYFEEIEAVTRDPVSHRARLSPLYSRQILNHLSNSNYLYR